jgi:hypothetical protein
MSTPVRARRSTLLASLVVGAGLAAAAAVAGWLLLLAVKGAVVLGAYALGIACIVVPLLVARRVVAGHRGRELRQRVTTIAQVVLLGVVLCGVAHLAGRHGWLLVALPAAAVLLGGLARGRARRRRVAPR